MGLKFFRISASRILGVSKASFNFPGITLVKRDRFTISVMAGRMTSKQSLRYRIGSVSIRHNDGYILK